MKTKKKSLFAWFGRTVAVGMVPLMLVACANNNNDDDNDAVVDIAPPTLSGSNPVNGGTIGAADNIYLSFSESVSSVNGSTVTLADSAGTAVAVTITGSGTYYTIDPVSNLSSGSYELTVGKGVTDEAGNAYAGSTVAFSVGGSSTVTTYNLSAGIDNPDSNDLDLTGANVFEATETTMDSGDKIDGGDGADIFRYYSSNVGATTSFSESAFTVANVEHFELNIDATGGTSFDMTNVTGAEKITNTNSSGDLSIQGVGNLVTLVIHDSSGGDTSLDYRAEAVDGSADEQEIELNDNINNDGTAVGNLIIDSDVETLNITTLGSKSRLAGINPAGGAATTINVSGSVDLTVDAALEDVTTVDASGFTGKLNIVVDSNGTSKDVSVTGGDGDDTVNWTDGWNTGDSFAGGAGTDTITITYATAQSATTGTSSAVEILDVEDNVTASGTIDMDNFAGIEKVILNEGIATAATLTIDDAVSGLEVEVDLDTAASGTLVVTLATDGSADTLSVTLDEIDEGDTLAGLSLADGETINLVVNDDDSGDASLTIASLTITDAAGSSLNISGDADLTITNVVDPTTPILKRVDASAMTGDLTISGMNTDDEGATIILGSGDDTLNMATNDGDDTITLGAGDDKLVYTSADQSTGVNSDKITDFVQGTDKIDLTALGLNSTSLFKGNATNQSAAETELTGVVGEAVYIQSENALIVDVNGNGDVDTGDFRLDFTGSGISELTAADVTLGDGNAITLTDSPATVSTTVKDNASAVATNEDDTITSTLANFVNSTIDASTGVDTLTITDEVEVGEITSLTTASATGAALTSVERIVMDDVDGLVTLGTNTPTTLERITMTGDDAGLSMTTQRTNMIITVNATSGTTASAITFGTDHHGTVTLGEGNDTVTLNYDNSTISTGDGNDTIIATETDVINANTSRVLTINGGADNDTFQYSNILAAAIDDNFSLITDIVISNVEVLDFQATRNAANTAFITGAGFTHITGGYAAGGSMTVTSDLASLDALTVIETDNGTFDYTVNEGGTIDLSSSELTIGAGGIDNLSFDNFTVTLRMDQDNIGAIGTAVTATGTADVLQVEETIRVENTTYDDFETITSVGSGITIYDRHISTDNRTINGDAGANTIVLDNITDVVSIDISQGGVDTIVSNRDNTTSSAAGGWYIVTGFTAGADSDIFQYDNGTTTLTGTNNFASNAAMYNIATYGSFDNITTGDSGKLDAAEVFVVDNSLFLLDDLSDGVAANSLDGTNILAAMGVTGSSITTSASDAVLFAVGDSGTPQNTAIYLADNDNATTSFTNGSFRLIGVLLNVDPDNLHPDNFAD